MYTQNTYQQHLDFDPKYHVNLQKRPQHPTGRRKTLKFLILYLKLQSFAFRMISASSKHFKHSGWNTVWPPAFLPLFHRAVKCVWTPSSGRSGGSFCRPGPETFPALSLCCCEIIYHLQTAAGLCRAPVLLSSASDAGRRWARVINKLAVIEEDAGSQTPRRGVRGLGRRSRQPGLNQTHRRLTETGRFAFTILTPSVSVCADHHGRRGGLIFSARDVWWYSLIHVCEEDWCSL